MMERKRKRMKEREELHEERIGGEGGGRVEEGYLDGVRMKNIDVEAKRESKKEKKKERKERKKEIQKEREEK